MLGSMSEMDPQTTEGFLAQLEAANLPPEVLRALEDLVQVILENPGDYAEIRSLAIQEGVPEEILPESFDVDFFTMFKMALDNLTPDVPSQPPLRMAKGGLASLPPPQMTQMAQQMQSMGRNGDTMLAHITPEEAGMLKAMGGSGTINPYTGLPEFFLKRAFKAVTGAVKSVVRAVGSVVKSVGKAVVNVVKGVASAVKKVAKSPIGRIAIAVAAGYFLGPMAAKALSGAAATAGATTISAALTSKVGVAAVGGFVGGFSSSALAGDKISVALKQGATGALTAGAMSGITGGSAAFQAGSYTGPTTISGQWDRLTGAARDFMTPASAQTITPAPGEIPPPAAGDYLSSGDAQALLQTQGELAAPGMPVPPPAPESIRALGEAAAPIEAPLSAATAPIEAPVAAPLSGQQTFTGTVSAPPEYTTYEPVATDYMSSPDAQNLLRAEGYSPDLLSTRYASPEGMSLSSVPSYSNLETTPTQQTTPKVTGGGGGGGTTAGGESPGIIDRTKEFFTNPSLDSFQNILVNPNATTFLGKYGPLMGAGALALSATGAMEAPPTDPTPLDFDPTTGEKIGGPSFKEQRPDLFADDRKLSAPGFELSETIVEPPRYGVMPQRGASPYSAPAFTLQPGGIPQPYNQEGFYGIPMLYMARSGSGIMGVEKFPRKTGPINGPGTGTSDSIPAMLSDGEFVFTAKAVRNMGNGSRRKGAARMYKMMKMLEGGPVGAARKKG
jgi:hypothetical protein